MAVALAIPLKVLGVAEREVPDVSGSALLVFGTIVAPLVETLVFQALPIAAARELGARFEWQVIASAAAFFAAHLFGGVGTGVCAGLVGGFYLAFTYAHWRERNRWTAFWVTALTHALSNGATILAAIAFSQT